MVDARSLEEHGRTQPAGGDDDLPGANDDPAPIDGAHPERDRPGARRLPADGRLDPGGASVLDEDPLDPGVDEEPGARTVGGREVGSQARLPPPGATAERARPALLATNSVAPRRAGVQAERLRATEQRGVLRRARRRLRDGQLGRELGVVRIGLRAVEAVDPVGTGPAGTDGGGRLDRGHPVDRRPAAEARPGQDRHRAVPAGGEAVVEVQPVVRVELGAGHRRLGQERPRLEDDDRPAGLGERLGDHARRRRRSPRSRRRRRGRPARRGRRRRSAGAPAARSASARSSGPGRRGRSRCPPSAGSRPRRRPGRHRPGRRRAGGTPGRPTAGARAATGPRRGGSARGPAGRGPRSGPAGRSGPGWRRATRAGAGRAGAGGPVTGRARASSDSAARAARRAPSPATNASASAARVAARRSAGRPAGRRPGSAGRRRVTPAGRPAPSPGPARARSGAAGPRGSRARSRPG